MQITIPDEIRIRACQYERKEMEKYIERANKYRSDFYHYHTGRSWDDAENYDLCINSGKLGFEKTVELIESYIKIK